MKSPLWALWETCVRGPASGPHHLLPLRCCWAFACAVPPPQPWVRMKQAFATFAALREGRGSFFQNSPPAPVTPPALFLVMTLWRHPAGVLGHSSLFSGPPQMR